ncbi:cupin domain-containing protein [Corynebacterium tapiri]|uniref:Cupin domain-containing protein n=1 Tax=Corynebacterium tapiri TaxID=1448266 RepID=A0A5C4U3I7_9CORY|nr:cupin domain-containing protein [Corynebacterium tapiri]TNL97597.1 cupin domain-containing protein [Corynebacterium tapiri]
MNDLRTDHGPNPYALNLEEVTNANDAFRDTLWTGSHLQMTVMSIPAGGEIGAEVHDDHDQFLRVESGTGHIMVGEDPDNLDLDRELGPDEAVFVPAGKWHNLVNESDQPVKLYSIYAAPDHVPGTVHLTKQDADNDPNEQH